MIREFIRHLNALADPDGGFMASVNSGYLGVADGRVSEISAATYAAELAQTLGFELPYPEKTAEYIQQRQHRDGYFVNLAPLPGVKSNDYCMYNTCVALRGLKALGKSPKYDPRGWLDGFIRSRSVVGPYEPDFYANSYAALEENMKPDCFDKLSSFLIGCQETETGWFIQPDIKDEGFPFERNNPFTFHAARFFHLGRSVVPFAERILDTFLRLQEEDGSWSLGGVHGTFDACVTLRMLGDSSDKYRAAIERAAEWAKGCMRGDGGFNHFGDKTIAHRLNGKDGRYGGYTDCAPSETDACYFHLATMVMAGKLSTPLTSANRWIGWGHTLVNDSNTK